MKNEKKEIAVRQLISFSPKLEIRYAYSAYLKCFMSGFTYNFEVWLKYFDCYFSFEFRKLEPMMLICSQHNLIRQFSQWRLKDLSPSYNQKRVGPIRHNALLQFLNLIFPKLLMDTDMLRIKEVILKTSTVFIAHSILKERHCSNCTLSYLRKLIELQVLTLTKIKYNK